MTIKDYIAKEKEWVGDWPEKPDTGVKGRQYNHLATEMIEAIRKRSLKGDISSGAHGRRVSEAVEVFDELREAMNDKNRMNAKQKENFSSQTFWVHKDDFLSGLYDFNSPI